MLSELAAPGGLSSEEKVELGRTYRVSKWFIAGIRDCVRDFSLSLTQLQSLGIETALRILWVRSEYLTANGLSQSLTDKPPRFPLQSLRCAACAGQHYSPDHAMPWTCTSCSAPIRVDDPEAVSFRDLRIRWPNDAASEVPTVSATHASMWCRECHDSVIVATKLPTHNCRLCSHGESSGAQFTVQVTRSLDEILRETFGTEYESANCS